MIGKTIKMFGFVFDRNNIREYRSNIFLTICYLCGFFYRVGIEVPTIEVRYERLTVEVEAYVGGRALPTLLNSVTNAVEVNLFNQILLYQLLLFLCFRISLLIPILSLVFQSILISLYILTNKKKHMTILKDVSGIVKPSRMTLLLGPPSSGKTTLLLALSGKLDPNLKVKSNPSGP